jgi:hypothetical protein
MNDVRQTFIVLGVYLTKSQSLSQFMVMPRTVNQVLYQLSVSNVLEGGWDFSCAMNTHKI